MHASLHPVAVFSRLGFAPWDVRVPGESLAAVAEGDGKK